MKQNHIQNHFNIRLLKFLLNQGRECEWIEFKENNFDPVIIGKTLSALSNSAFLHDEAYGYLIYGIKNESLEIIGTSYKPKIHKVGNQEVENWLATQLDPRIDFRIIEFDTSEGRVVFFRVDATRVRPVSFKGNEFIRIGSYTKRLKEHPEMERKIWGKASRESFETQKSEVNLTDDQILSLLNYTTYFDLTEQPLPSNKESLLTKLEEEKLIVSEKNGTKAITNLGAILFAKDLKHFTYLQRKAVRVIIYKGKNRLITIKELEERKGYAAGFEELVHYINDQLPTHEQIEKTLRKKIHVFPTIAIRELVANMLIHQDFDISGTGPMVEIFSDRIEVSNPGKPLINTLRLLDHNPRSRNEKLAYFMRRIKVCEERGSGIDKVVAATETNNLPAPNFIYEDQYFKTILYGPKSLKQMTKRDKVRTTYLHSCLKYISSEVMTNESLRSRLGIKKANYPLASRIIKETLKEELIKPSDPDNKAPKHSSYIPFWA